jgi:hypothetical protein
MLSGCRGGFAENSRQKDIFHDLNVSVARLHILLDDARLQSEHNIPMHTIHRSLHSTIEPQKNRKSRKKGHL